MLVFNTMLTLMLPWLRKANVPGGFLTVEDKKVTGFTPEIMMKVFRRQQFIDCMESILSFPQEVVLCHGYNWWTHVDSGKSCVLYMLVPLWNCKADISIWIASPCISWTPAVVPLVCNLTGWIWSFHISVLDHTLNLFQFRHCAVTRCCWW